MEKGLPPLIRHTLAEGNKMVKKTVLLNPTAKKDQKPKSIAAERVSGLSGKIIEFLDNNKPNADLLLKLLRDCIGKSYENVGFVNVAKMIPARPLDNDIFEALANNCDLVVNGVGD